MKKLYYILFVASFLLTVMMNSATASATSWVEIEPQEVVDRAEVVVSGTYNFSSQPEPSDFIFQGQEFDITHVYKGEVANPITAGIDGFDVGWVEEYQEEGGEFLLFLEASKDADFLIPVAGPNGMVQLKGGKVVGPNQAFYEDFLKSHPEQTIATEVEPSPDTQDEHSSFLVYGSILVLIGVGVAFFLYRYKKKT
ncbi:hypothetical protein [Pontibacillus salipaludis]|uniref:Gram-positive cocci surface proteins LPxTG domain-containing protein n=1 Tax=Pontibacillus salipaludis TaxID=1697394 RepID=A0ABQ1Q5D0_9BACI|nr:hypothetical protein [Pontibacillus salipaludis]GGD13932.1 hypothetical protein GCM10011389_21990 [Pontibacillus salipaludis]